MNESFNVPPSVLRSFPPGAAQTKGRVQRTSAGPFVVEVAERFVPATGCVRASHSFSWLHRLRHLLPHLAASEFPHIAKARNTSRNSPNNSETIRERIANDTQKIRMRPTKKTHKSIREAFVRVLVFCRFSVARRSQRCCDRALRIISVAVTRRLQ